MISQKVCICTISVIKCLHFDLMLKSLRGEIYNYRFFPLKKSKHLKVYTFFKIQFQNKSLAFFFNSLDFRIFKIYVTITTIQVENIFILPKTNPVPISNNSPYSHTQPSAVQLQKPVTPPVLPAAPGVDIPYKSSHALCLCDWLLSFNTVLSGSSVQHVSTVWVSHMSCIHSSFDGYFG